MAVLSCFALFLWRPDGRVSLQGYKKQENHNFTSSAAGTKCKTTAPGIYLITAVDNAPTNNLDGENQISLTGDQTALMIMGNLILLTVGQNWPGR